MTFEGVCLGGPLHGRTLASENNQMEVLSGVDVKDWSISPTPARPVIRRPGWYYHHYIKLMSGGKVGIWDWAGWV